MLTIFGYRKLDELVKEVKRLQSVVESQGIPSSGVVGDDCVDAAQRVPAPTANGQAIAAMNHLDEVHLSPQYLQGNNTGHASIKRSERLSYREESSASGPYVNASGAFCSPITLLEESNLTTNLDQCS